MKTIALEHWLASDLDSTTLPRLLCVFTDEPLFLTQAADLYRKALRDRFQAQRQVVEADRQFDGQAFIAQFAEASLFGDVNLIDLRVPQNKLNKEVAEAVTQVCGWIAAGHTEHFLLVTGPRLNKTQEKTAGFAQLLQTGTEIICKPVGIDTLPAWLIGNARRMGINLDREAASWLAEKTEGNLLAAHQALEKLAIEHQGAVSFEQVQQQVANAARFNVFDLGSSLLAGDSKRIVRMIEGLKAEGEAPTLVLWALQEEIRAIGDTQHAMRRGMSLSDACRQNRIWGSKQQHITAALRRHSGQSLQALTQWCYRAEKTIKGMQAGDPWSLFEIIGLGIAGVQPPTHLEHTV